MNTGLRWAQAALIFAAAVYSWGCNTTSAPSPGANSVASTAAEPSAFTSAAGLSETDAITAAIREHLKENRGINMSVMDMTVAKVAVNGDQAQADAEFRLKQGGTTMSVTYSLQRHADGWIVITSHPAGGEFAHPPMDKVHSGTGAAPPGAPAQSSSSSSVPDVSDYFRNH